MKDESADNSKKRLEMRWLKISTAFDGIHD
jgi:hypothetical protein